jgi:hypothetical protein
MKSLMKLSRKLGDISFRKDDISTGWDHASSEMADAWGSFQTERLAWGLHMDWPARSPSCLMRPLSMG